MIALAWLVPLLLSLPDVHLAGESDARAHVDAASSAATSALPVELLLAVAWVESRYDRDAVSVLIDGARSTGVRRSTKRPAGKLSSMHCGVTQATARSWAHCVALRDLGASYRATAASLTRWLAAAGGDLSRGLAGYGCGWKGARTGKCNGYPGRVARVMRKLMPVRGVS